MSAQAPRVPAWKRLGLKLKGPACPGSPVSGAHVHQQPSTTPAKTNSARTNLGAGSANKRKSPSTPHRDTEEASKRPRRDGEGGITSTVKRQKSVLFAAGTKGSDAQGTTHTESKRKPPKKKKKKKKRSKIAADDASSKKKTKSPATEPDPAFDLTPALTYLRQWSTDRTAWKFNKNHQTLLVKYVFAADRAIPGADLPIFLDYIRALNGGVRARLRDAAMAVKLQSDAMEELEPTSAPAVTKKGADDKDKDTQEAKKQDLEAKQKVYENAITRYLAEVKEAREEAAPPSPGKTASKRSFDEVEFVLRTVAATDSDVKQRVIKRIRAERILEALADSEESTTTDNISSSASSGRAAGEMMDVDDDNAETKPTLQDTVVEDGPSQAPRQGQQPKAKRVRQRKLRTAAIAAPESSSSSDSESEGEGEGEDGSSSNSSSSSEDSDDDEQELRGPAAGDDAATSSSSSSSESDSEASESDDESGAADGEDGGGEEE